MSKKWSFSMSRKKSLASNALMLMAESFGIGTNDSRR